MAFALRENKKDQFESVFLLNIMTGAISKFTDDKDYFKHSPAFSPSGKMITYNKWKFGEKEIEESIMISRLDRSCEWTIPLDDMDHFAWSPDGRKMFLAGSSGVYIADLEKVFGESFISGVGCP